MEELVSRVWDEGCESWVFKWVRELITNELFGICGSVTNASQIQS